jgi:hypothetical protein
MAYRDSANTYFEMEDLDKNIYRNLSTIFNLRCMAGSRRSPTQHSSLSLLAMLSVD